MTKSHRGVSAAVVATAALTVVLTSSAHAAATPLEPDPHQPANGAAAPAYRSDNTVTPAYSPIQVPKPLVSPADSRSRTIVYTAYPYLASWLHNAIGRQPLELRGAARVTFVDPVSKRIVVINPNGHCDFTDGHHAGAGTPLRPIRVDTGAFAVTIHPIAHVLAR
ncbi:hypothetical protein GOEFS_115_01040 [Gordonia effusa NBRC 100432]|uniref:RlpA-like protein double-psi beta-barrel domain-containing protein n=1 Tax=Gordonia effusa NBRC 100432 TaxID=1077974 RepID=H0R5W3_9ACTN|nr:hypothetical protein [Gordonia effusa]GAB20464.1 hypothetical protein GOEFS_115_01040 [Gordonia effusa NBRC 100432]